MKQQIWEKVDEQIEQKMSHNTKNNPQLQHHHNRKLSSGPLGFSVETGTTASDIG